MDDARRFRDGIAMNQSQQQMQNKNGQMGARSREINARGQVRRQARANNTIEFPARYTAQKGTAQRARQKRKNKKLNLKLASLLLAASIMAAPGALVVSKIVFPTSAIAECTGTFLTLKNSIAPKITPTTDTIIPITSKL